MTLFKKKTNKDRALESYRESGDLTKVAITIESGLVIPLYDSGAVAYPTDTQEIYTFKLATFTVMTLTINYTTPAKDVLLNWTTV